MGTLSDFFKPRGGNMLPGEIQEQRRGLQWLAAKDERRDFVEEVRERGTAEKMRRMFGLHPAIAALAIITGGALGTAELVGLVTIPLAGLGLEIESITIPIGLALAILLSLITYLAQEEWGGDSKKSALLKALMVGFLTALPGGVLGYKKLGKIMGELNS